MKFLKLLSFAFFICSAHTSVALADTVDADGILKNNSGQLVVLGFDEAMKVCPEGTHIPSAREAAAILQSHGARGIDELAPPNCGFSDNASRVTTYRSSGAGDTFCFYHDGFVAPPSDLAKGIFWTSSDARAFEKPYRYAFYGSSAGFQAFYSGRRSAKLHVLCVPNVP